MRTSSLLRLGSAATSLGLLSLFVAEAHAQTPPEAPAPELAPPSQDQKPAEPAPAGEAPDTHAPAEAPAPAEPTPAESTPAETAPDAVDAAPSGGGLFEESLSGSTPAPGTSDGATAPAFDLHGYARGDVFVGKVPDFRQAEMKAAYGELSLQLQTRREPYGDGFAEARLRYGLQGERRELFVDLREAYVNAYLGRLHLRLGHQIVVWGRADAFNPTNNLTPSDLRIRSPIEDDRRLGNVGARLFLDLSPLRFEGVWMPVYAAMELPEVVLPEYVTLGEPDFPRPEVPNGTFGARLHLELSSFEMSGSYVYGHALLPGLALRSFTVGVDPPEVTIARTAYDHHVVGLDFSTAIGETLAVRGEAAYRHPVDHESRIYAPTPDLQYVLGLDRTFGSVSVIVQYIGRYVFDWKREEGPDMPVDPAALATFMPPLPPFLSQSITDSINAELAARNQVLFSQTEQIQHLASVRLEWVTAHDTLSLSALGLVNVSTREWLLFPKLGYDISDAMTAYVGAEVYMGPDDTLFGLIDEELSAAYAELRFAF